GAVSWAHLGTGKTVAAATCLGLGLRVTQGGVGYYESRSSRVRDPGCGVQFARDSRIRSARRDRTARPTRPRARDGSGQPPTRRIARVGGVAWERGALIR